MQQFKDYYVILKISRTATDEEINTAYRNQSLEWHPDRNPGLDTHKVMQEINEAKQVLLNPIARQKYNNEYDAINNPHDYSPKMTVYEKAKESNWGYWWLSFVLMNMLSHLIHGCNQ